MCKRECVHWCVCSGSYGWLGQRGINFSCIHLSPTHSPKQQNIYEVHKTAKLSLFKDLLFLFIGMECEIRHQILSGRNRLLYFLSYFIAVQELAILKNPQMGMTRISQCQGYDGPLTAPSFSTSLKVKFPTTG